MSHNLDISEASIDLSRDKPKSLLPKIEAMSLSFILTLPRHMPIISAAIPKRMATQIFKEIVSLLFFIELF